MADQLNKPPLGRRARAYSDSGSANAPIIYFDGVPTFGLVNGVVSITLEASRLYANNAGAPVTDLVVVAHLRMSVPSLQALKGAVDGALLMASPPSSEAKN